MVEAAGGAQIDTGYVVNEGETPKYTLKEKLGEGAFGKVFKAVDKNGTFFAIKIISNRIKNAGEKKWECFVREITHLSELDSDYIIRMYGKPLEQDEHYFLILEYCNSGDLLNYLLNKEFKISMQEVMEISNDIAFAIFVMHSAEIAHRDLKLENIMVHTKAQRSFKLADLGLSRQINDIADTVAGSLGYIAPEIFLSKDYDRQADIWSFGMLLFQLAFKEFPFGRATYQMSVMRGKCNIPNKRTVSKNYIDLLTKCLKFDPKKRLKIEDILSHDFFMSPDNQTSSLKQIDILKE